MNTIKSFEQWLEEDFSKVYRQFHKDYNFFFKKKNKRYKKMNLDARLKHFFSHFINIDIRPKYFIKMSCMCCGEPVGSVRNHVIGDANYLKKYLSRNGHVYVLKKDYKRHFGLRGKDDLLSWNSGYCWWKCTGHKTSDVTFRCFCQKCDTKLFSDIDGGIKDEKSFLNQIYRSACSLYFRILEQSIKMCYIADVSRNNPWLDIMFQEQNIEGKQILDANTTKAHVLEESYHRYCIVKQLQSALDSKENVVNVTYLSVESPSIYCGFLSGHRLPGKEFEMVNNVYREVNRVSSLVVVLPVKKNETVVLEVTLPLGIKGYAPMVEDLSISARPDIVLSRYIVELGLLSLGDFYMSPRFYDSLPPEYLDSITDVNKHSDLPAISLFDMDFDIDRILKDARLKQGKSGRKILPPLVQQLVD